MVKTAVTAVRFGYVQITVSVLDCHHTPHSGIDIFGVSIYKIKVQKGLAEVCLSLTRLVRLRDQFGSFGVFVDVKPLQVSF